METNFSTTGMGLPPRPPLRLRDFFSPTSTTTSSALRR